MDYSAPLLEANSRPPSRFHDNTALQQFYKLSLASVFQGATDVSQGNIIVDLDRLTLRENLIKEIIVIGINKNGLASVVALGRTGGVTLGRGL
jgi:hypothetical protein